MNILVSGIPTHIQKEIEQLQSVLAPLMKKVSRYTIWTFPLITVSIFNLFFLLLVNPLTSEVIPTTILYAVLGSLGFALLRETRMQHKEIQKVSEGYMIDRIRKSTILSDQRKEQYIARVKAQPSARTIQYFIEFLIEEDRKKHL